MKVEFSHLNLRQLASQINWYLCGGVLFLILVLLTLLLSGWKLQTVVTDAKELPIEAVIVRGERMHTRDSDIQQALQGLLDRSFFSADVAQIQTTLEALPWVYRASVQREWPSKLKVFIQEQEVIARWNDQAWLNRHGDIFRASDTKGILNLPSLFGPDSMTNEILSTYKQLSELLNINGLKLTKLSLSPRHAWHVQLENGIQLDLGREDKVRRVQRFIRVYPDLQRQDKAISKIDLRYDTGLAVGWLKNAK